MSEALLEGHRGLIIGCANERSLAFGIAQGARHAGARLALTYQNDILARRVLPMGETLGAELCLPLDLTAPPQLAAAVQAVSETFGGLDFVVHAVAMADRHELGGRFIDTSRDGFLMAMEVSAFSLVATAKAFEPLLLKSDKSPSILTLSYIGSQRVVPNYNVMGVCKAALEAAVRYLAHDLGPSGIRVNALSPGPIKTLSAAGVRGLRSMLQAVPKQAPLRRNVEQTDVAGAAVFYLSALASGITGEITAVDGGFSIMGAPSMELLSPKQQGKTP